VTVLDRDGEEKSKLAAKRLDSLLRTWESKLREEKFKRAGLPKDYDRMFELKDSQSAKPPLKKAANELRDTLVKAFPFILMMWLVAGAVQPAVDLTAGEKERGTMETLLISPAERNEIVLGKFLAVTLFTFASVLWNVLWLAVAAIVLGHSLGGSIIHVPGLLGCLVLAVPLAMLFSAISLALGVFARSTKEGQYYLIPLIMVVMPLALASMTPGAELSVGKACVPVLGSMLFMQKLLSPGDEAVPWAMLVPVLAGLTIAVMAALALAVVQFQRESVLFREAAVKRRGLRLFSMKTSS
jgi:sodium transport system permease protein